MSVKPALDKKPPIRNLPIPGKPDRICVLSRDKFNSVFGVISISRDCILDVEYNGIHHQLTIVLKSYTQQGESMTDLFQKSAVENGKKVMKTGWTEHLVYTYQGYNHRLQIVEEDEMKKVWDWLGHNDITFGHLLDIRKEMLATIEKAKAALKQKEEEELKKKEEASKLVDEQGKPLS